MMDLNFVKPLNNERYDIETAIAFVKHYPNDNIGIMLMTDEPIPEPTRIIPKETIMSPRWDPMTMPAKEYLSKNWQLVVPDYERWAMTTEVREFMMEEVPGFELDTRFYDESEMTITDWFNRLHEWLRDEDVKYKIFMFLKENELLKNAKYF